MENLCRAFLFDEDVAVIHEYDTLTEPYILTSVHDGVRVVLCADGESRELSAPLCNDNELCMAQLMYRLLSEKYRRELPWGILTGVRPVKLFSRLADKDGEESARRYFSDSLYVSDEKTDLASQVRRNQEHREGEEADRRISAPAARRDQAYRAACTRARAQARVGLHRRRHTHHPERGAAR